MASIYGVDDVFNGFAGAPYTTYADWEAGIDQYIATLKRYGGTMADVIVMTCQEGYGYSFYGGGGWQAGYMDPTFTTGHDIPNYTWAQLLRAFSDKLHAQGLKLGIQPAAYSYAQSGTILATPSLRTQYINEIRQIVIDVNPDVFNIHSEMGSLSMADPPVGTGQDYPTDTELAEYVAFVSECATALKNVKSNLQLAVMALPFWDPAPFVAAGGFSGLPADTSLFAHYYTSDYNGNLPPSYYLAQINYWYAPSDGTSTTVTIDGVPTVVNLAQAKAYLFADFDYLIQPVLNHAPPIPFVFEALGCNATTPNALQSIKDAMEWCKLHNVGWNTSGNIGGDRGGWSDPCSWIYASSSELNEFGKAMFNGISPVTLPFNDSFTILDPKWQTIKGTWGAQ